MTRDRGGNLNEGMVNKNTVFLAVILVLLFFSGANADVIQLKNGEVLLGKASVGDSNTVIIESFGKKRNVRQTDILKIDGDLTSLAKEECEVLLSDDSVLKGKVKNFDDDVGLLLESAFGAITVPTEGHHRAYITSSSATATTESPITWDWREAITCPPVISRQTSATTFM